MTTGRPTTANRNPLQASLICICLLLLISSAAADQPKNETLYYAVEQNGVLCGYSQVDISRVEVDGKRVTKMDERVEMHIKALGASVVATFEFSYHIDPETNMYFYHECTIDQGSVHLAASMQVLDSIVSITSEPDDDVVDVEVPAGVLFENTRLFSHLLREFESDSPGTKDFKMFSEVNGAVHDISYEYKGIEELELNGNGYSALSFRKLDRTIGMKIDMLIDEVSGYMLKAASPGRVVYLSDSSTVSRITEGDLDENLLAPVNVAIADFKAISYMKVKALLEPGGEWITPSSLNIPGQTFEGTVEENLIDGIFEITHQKYDGSNAPPFPADYGDDESIVKYTKPAELIESDEQVLIDEARKITNGAVDSWDALKRLSAWVAENISYDIPGGATAINTYNTRLGECGSHSNLVAAFCRAVGIPCRVVWGCMYIPQAGGSFGQHAWNEVYMGEAGWIPIDATAEEIDYVDCGHIRLGVREKMVIYLNPHEMEIIDYKTGSGDNLAAVDHSPYLGEYQGERGTVNVTEQNGCLAVVIPSRPVFELNEPDEHDNWYFKITNQALVKFESNESGEITEMTINSVQRLPRMTEESEADTIAAVPDDFLPYVGKYVIPMRGVNIEVVFSDSNLTIDYGNGKILELDGPGDGNAWIGKVGTMVENIVSFVKNDAGAVTAVEIEEVAHFTKLAALTGN